MSKANARLQAQSEIRRFGRRIFDARTHAGLTQEQLAERCGLHVTYVSGLERARRNPTLIVIVAIARALGVKPAALLEDD